MENSRLINCGSTFPPATAVVVSSSSSSLPEPRNQMGMNLDHSSYLHFTQVSRLALHGVTQEAVFQGAMDSSLSGSSTNEELRSSFAAVLSWPQSQIQFDVNGASNLANSCASGKVSGDGAVNLSGYGAGIQMLNDRLPLEARRKNKMQGKGASDCPLDSSEVTNSDCSRKSISDISFTDGNLGFGSSIQAKADNHNIAQDQLSNFISGCPRVFCLNKSGRLLLSSTGIMGILCSCHLWHMSVSDFCEHSGSSRANPGTTVHLESGETVAQWCKLHFQKLGIRVVEDRIGWEWPLGLSAGLTRSCASMSSKTNSCDLDSLASSPGDFMKYSQPVEKLLAPKFLERSQNLVEALYDREQRSQDSTHFSKGLHNAFAISFQPVSDNQIQESLTSKRPSPALRLPNAVCPSALAHVGSVVNNGKFSMSHPTMQSLSIPSKSYNDNNTVLAKDAASTERDTAFSNIELRLGQPYQKSQQLRNSSFSVASSKPLETHIESSNSICLEQLIHNVATGREKGDSEKYFYSVAGTPDFKKGREAGQVYLGNHASKTSGVVSLSRPEEWRDMNQSYCSAPIKQLNVSSKGFERPKASSNGLGRGACVSKSALYESHGAKYHSYNVSWDVTGLVSSAPDNGLNRSEAKGKRMRSNPTGSNPVADITVGVKQQVEKPCSLPWVTCGSMFPGFSTADNGACYQHLPSIVRRGAADARNVSNNPGRVPTFEFSACTSGSAAMSRCLPASSGTNLQPAAVLRSCASVDPLHVLSSIARHEMANVSPYILNDQMRLLAQRQISDLFDQHHGVSSAIMNKESDNIEALDSLKVPLPVNQMHGTLQSTNQTSIGYSQPSVQSTETNTCYVPKRGSYLETLFTNKSFPYEQAQSRDHRNENTEKPGNNENCGQNIACTCFQGNCSNLAHANQLRQVGNLRSGSSSGFLKHQFDSSKEHVFPSEKPFCLDQMGNLSRKSPRGVVYDSSLWRDIPRKHKGICDMECVEWSLSVSGKDKHDEGQCQDIASKSLIRSAQVSAASKEQEMSNVSFGSSGHAVTQASVEGRNVAHFAADSRNTGDINDPVFDEGSGIDKCWSSDEAPESEASVEFMRERSSEVLKNQSSRSLLDELKLMDSLMWKKGRSQFPALIPTFEKMSPSKSIKIKYGKQKNEAIPLHDGCAKFSGCFEVPSRTFKSKEVFQPARKKPCVEPVRRPEQPGFSLTKENCCKRDLCVLNYQRDLEDDSTFESDDDTLEIPQGKKIKTTQIDPCQKFFISEKAHHCSEKATDSNSAKPSSGQLSISFCMKAQPRVHGKYGELSCGKAVGELKQTKFLSLSRILKTTSRCSPPRECEPGFTSLKKLRKKNFNEGHLASRLKNINEKGKVGASFNCEMNSSGSVVESGRLYAGQDVQSAYNLSKPEKEDEDKAMYDCYIQNREKHIKLRPKHKKVRIRSIYELTGKGKDSTYERQTLLKTSECINTTKEGQFPKKTLTGRCCEPMICEVDGEKSTHLTKGVAGSFLDASCSVCGNVESSEVNRLLQCIRCLIKVHQACYGVSRIPKGDWYCRPCSENSDNFVCVLCGYGGGAMTRALQSGIIITSLLKVWNFNKEQGDKVSSGPRNAAQPTTMISEMQAQNNLKILDSSAGNISNLKMRNSVTEGLLNSGVKQWVHMVCGLWTPGTRCPNVHTMSAFDVSGVSYPRPSTVCALCNRRGGSCIKCRVISCCVQFHPWCAHQKGLLQGEVEGDNNENVGFYGRCTHHAATATHESSSDLMDSPRDKEFTCARTEGYKRRKQDRCSQDLYGKQREKGSCLVPQEQVNAWIHINGQKSRMLERSIIPTITAENDCRKEYLRYKQARGWRHLVVYKSGIHALGLYTSRFISRGEMVVEYIGEIVGPRVADRREREYESGKNVQYRSACYFFRIDKENIIDATRKGGIARFVNHSCRPNCVARVISIRNDKKVVFFAERDIYPGEEITYDYHFNHEDEGKKIPCLCDSRNCRHFLN